MIFHAAKAAAVTTVANQMASIAVEWDWRALAVLSRNGAKRDRERLRKKRRAGAVTVPKRRLLCSKSRNQESGTVWAPVCSQRNLSAQATSGRNISWS